jgi:hypothetical protein
MASLHDQSQAQNQPEKIGGKTVERVGVIVVHGIGEQRRFEHLEAETRKVVHAIIAKYGKPRRLVTPTLTAGECDAFLGDQASWASGAAAPLHTLVEWSDRIVDIAFHEVWWADINESLTLGKQIRFWAWGMSLAGIATSNDPYLLGAKRRTRPPDHAGDLTLKNRIRMGFVSVLFGFSAFSVALINLFLKRLDFKPFPLTNIIVNYLSAVKLYSQDTRAGGSPMDGPDEPPRAAIRRRMIRVMVDVARADYKRWYILAHSLGTIVAWNGLMEIQQALPNYLDRECWDELKGRKLRGAITDAFGVDRMMPNRPLWVNKNEIIDRDALFEKFAGVLTYGSPLERFCALWSAMVPINCAEDPFPAGAEWVNVYDPTDPVGTWICDYDPKMSPRAGHTTLTPQNFPCRADPLLLVSHISYLNVPSPGAKDAKDYLVNQVAEWLVEGGSLTVKLKKASEKPNAFWMPRAETEPKTHQLTARRRRSRLAQAGLAALLLTWLTLLSLEYVILPSLRFAKGILSPFTQNVLHGLKLSFLIPWFSALLLFADKCASTLGSFLSSLWNYVAARLDIWTWLPKFVIEGILLWIVMIVVVFFASIYHNNRGRDERQKTRNRFQSGDEHTAR